MSEKPLHDEPLPDELHCGFCQQPTEGLTLYSVLGQFRLMVCEGCYAQLIAKAQQPYAHVTQRLHRQLGLATTRRS